MFRDRTNLYLSYRRTFPHHKRPATSYPVNLEEEEESIGLMGYRDEAPALPPVFYDVGLELDDTLKHTDVEIAKLNKLYQKNLLPGFNDRSSDEEEIEKLNYMITRKFQGCYKLIKRLDTLKGSAAEAGMVENMKKNYAIRVQETTARFRKLQNNYIRFLKDEDFEQAPLQTAVMEDSKSMENYSRQALNQSQSLIQRGGDSLLREREREISSIAQGVLEVSTIFREMQNMVIDQGTMLDRIDYNMGTVVEEMKGADRELSKAGGYQKSTQKCKLMVLMILVCFMLTMIVVLKWKGGESAAPAPAPAPTQAPNPNPTTASVPSSVATLLGSSGVTKAIGPPSSVRIPPPGVPKA